MKEKEAAINIEEPKAVIAVVAVEGDTGGWGGGFRL